MEGLPFRIKCPKYNLVSQISNKGAITVYLTGWATMHCLRCLRVSVKREGTMHDVELARIVSSFFTRPSRFEKTFFFMSIFSGVFSYKNKAMFKYDKFLHRSLEHTLIQ